MTHDPLIAMALLGTTRTAALPPTPTPSLEATWKAIASDDPADAVLQALALVRAMHLGGAKSHSGESPAAACAIEPRETFSPGAVAALARLLKGEFREALPEWLFHASASGRVLPGRALPDLLEAASKDHALRPVTRQLAGERGRWIAGRHPKFSWIFEGQSVDEACWDEGFAGERLAWLRQTRASDPPRAMEAVAANWAGEETGMRQSILRVISSSPRPGDEAWLEQTAMKDRRQEVRDLAAVSLVMLADSAFRKRALGRAAAHVKLQRRMLRRVLAIEPPAAFDPSWQADGIREKPPQGTGGKAWWLRQMTGMVPLDEWPVLLGCEAGGLFGYDIDPDWKETLLLGWMDAALRFPGRALPEQSVPFLASLDPWPAASVQRVAAIASILDAFPPERVFQVLDSVIGKLPREGAMDLLARQGGPPPPGTGSKVLAAIDSALVSTPPVFHRQQARALALCIPQQGILPRLELLAKLSELSPAVEEFATMLEFRRTLPALFKTP